LEEHSGDARGEAETVMPHLHMPVAHLDEAGCRCNGQPAMTTIKRDGAGAGGQAARRP